MTRWFLGLLALASVLASTVSGQAPTLQSSVEREFLSRIRRLTVEGRRAGEGYWAPNGQSMVFQSEREPGNPFYQIYRLNLTTGTSTRVSPGLGKTTCSFINPITDDVLFASTHHDVRSKQLQDEELAFRASGKERRYAWDYDPEMEIYVRSSATGTLRRLTNALGYDAEASYSPDGQWIAFSSTRDAYNRQLSAAEQKQLGVDPSYFGEIYLMRADADGTPPRRLTSVPGYDGGPFFSPDGAWIAYRTDRLEKDMLQIHVMKADGTGDLAVTAGQGVRWAPYWHPTKPWLIWTGADHSDPTKRPNYDLWIAGYDTADGTFRVGEPLRITDHEGADVLPAFSPDGTLLMWTASRGEQAGGRGPTSQLWVSRLDLDEMGDALDASSPGTTKGSTP